VTGVFFERVTLCDVFTPNAKKLETR
jgi:hypothetical protein